MPSFVSLGGKWSPAKEIAHAIKNNTGQTLEHEWIIGPDGSHKVDPGDKFTYNGPDREAVKMLAEAGQEYLGQDFRNDPEFLQGIRNMGFDSVESYLKSIGYDEEKVKAEFKKKADTTITKHSLPKRANEIHVMSGGKSRGEDKANFIGGFGTERLRDASELKSNKSEKVVA